MTTRVSPVVTVDADDFSAARLARLYRASLDRGLAPLLFGEEEGRDDYVLWRHDIDIDLEATRRVARLEAELGIRSTYFLMTRSWFYNLLSHDGEETIAVLKSLGHQVGLHCDLGLARDAAVSDAEVEARVARDFAVVEAAFGAGALAPVVSFHNPPHAVLRKHYSFYSAYQPRFFGEIKYLSDSNRHWREGPPEAWFARDDVRKLSVLLHPIIWASDGRTMPEAVAAFCGARREELLRRLEEDDVRVRE